MQSRIVSIAAGGVDLEGDLTLWRGAQGLVIFAHGSGSSRRSPRNRFVARRLDEAGIGTLLVDLVSAAENAADAGFDLDLVGGRLAAVVDHVLAIPDAHGLRLGLFGASTGAAAALAAAATRPRAVRAIVARGGRPDLAAAILPRVTAPTLLIVGGADEEVLELNREAAGSLPDARLVVVPDAAHLFEEPGAIEEVARLTCGWFLHHLGGQPVGQETSLPFADRSEAGELLARRLRHYAGRPDAIVLGLPRGGVPVAAIVARALGAPLDALVVRKLGTPGQKELAVGAIAPGGVRVINRDVAAYVPDWAIEDEEARERLELLRRERVLRGERPPPGVAGKIAILVDDGVATGATMRAAIAWAHRHRPTRVVVAVPVAAREAAARLGREADELVCLAALDDFAAVGLCYRDFRPVPEGEVAAILGESRPGARAT
jgi:predicted phosphoribosyltransferase/pimeloyl-ACP methyl ester carboxylesterase